MAASKTWLPWHDTLHRQLLRQPNLLPDGETLLIALSGGQDSMALLGLLLGLQHLHHWHFQLWHGDHGWHDQSAATASELKEWCQSQELPLQISRNTRDHTGTEANARSWRYQELAALSQQFCCRTVLTAHTASDRAETLLLQLARGTDLAGLGSLRPIRPLQNDDPSGARLVRPLLTFSRDDTTQICQDLQLPIWLDPSNANPALSRNRIRNDVLPVLEELYPGCSQRIAQLSERMSQVEDSQRTLATLALEQLRSERGLQRNALKAVPEATRRLLLHHWLQQQGVRALSASQLNTLSFAIGPGCPPGSRSLAEHKTLQWTRDSVQLVSKP
ncbi:tRNA(Ile)-lysidine synthetase [Synechococcus sp. WH 8020]|uniref:tRNA lysidine(34) synthetase TilS n=1 Tax=Synechococcus sp. (strain WH8020) TaxID=32052 RepID=UPI00065285C2|nr:tRNA lysidine(34) synthetase TilS [Synechococcus sp. WH 8020]AKN62406.1 tRNA(Ile)-lysidine synthetase [Synechococcus sp. WH 8020]